MSNGKHFYTADADEVGTALAQTDFQLETVACFVCDEGLRASGGVPLFHFSHPDTGAHLYTASEEEAMDADADGYQYEGETGYVFRPGSQPTGTVPLHHLFRPDTGDHLYLIGPEAVDKARQAGYQPQGIAAYVYDHPMPGAKPLYRFYRSSTAGDLAARSLGNIGAVSQAEKWLAGLRNQPAGMAG